MGSNSFGTIFKITTFGESHGSHIGVVIDGCPAGLHVSETDINNALKARAPGQSVYTTERKESDEAVILSGVFEGKTTGAPICILINNQDADSSKYEAIKDILRPGHANFTYLSKYGIFDHKGGGRASARETACRVAAGAIALKFLEDQGITVLSYIKQIGDIKATIDSDINSEIINKSPLFCPDAEASLKMEALVKKYKDEGDSIGALVEFRALSVPVGIGDPVYEKLDAKLSHSMMSLPAVKGFEIGDGFECVSMQGSFHNDLFYEKNGSIQTKTNHAGGILAGISTGMPIIGRVAFKPASSIKKSQKSLDIHNKPVDFIVPEGSRHDPCVGIRAVPVVKAMAAIVLVDAILLNRCSRC
jgi:chorismate synthase